LIKRKDIAKYIKAQTIHWWGKPNRMEGIKPVKKITDWYPSQLKLIQTSISFQTTPKNKKLPPSDTK
jgi:hypothetical protein